MSTWRDIWRFGVIANRFFSEDEQTGINAFYKLKEVYDRPPVKNGKDRRDGMIRYIMAEAYELRFQANKDENYKKTALENYSEAEQMFPVDHWKKVAHDSYTRLSNNYTPEKYFDYKYEKAYDVNGNPILDKNKKQKYIITSEFNTLLWYAFQKVYSFVNLNDFARYVSLSALSRGSSEWPLSLVDFRTVLELEIKQCYPDIVDSFNETDRYSLYRTIEKLEEKHLIDQDIRNAFDNIRKAGNIAAHDLYGSDYFKKENVVKFIKVLEFFNNYRGKNVVISNKVIPYPLNQLNYDEFVKQLDEEKKILTENKYYE